MALKYSHLVFFPISNPPLRVRFTNDATIPPSPHFSQRDYIEGGKRRGYFHLDDPGGSALLSRRQRRNWTPIAAIRLCTSQCPIRRRSDSLVADSADNPQIARLNHRLQFVGAGPTPVGIA